jgi:hypothetical protein
VAKQSHGQHLAEGVSLSDHEHSILRVWTLKSRGEGRRVEVEKEKKKEEEK